MVVARLQATARQYAALDGRIWLLAAVRAVNTMGMSLAMAFMAIYMVEDRSLSARLYGSIFLGANLLQSLSQGWSGELSDRLGRRRIMVAALFARSLVVVAIGTEVVFDADIWLIAATLMVSSSLRGWFEPVAYAVVADVATPAQRVPAYGLQRMGTNLGWAMGPALGGALSGWLGYGKVFFISAGSLWIAAAVTSRLRDPGRGDMKADARVSLVAGLRQAFARADASLLLLCSLLFALVHVQLFSTLSIYTASEVGLSKADLGVAYGINGALVLLLQIPAVGVIRRIGTGRALVTGALLYVASFLAVGLSSSLVHVVGAVTLLTLGEITVAPAHQAAAAELGDGDRMGRAFGLLGLSQMLGVAIAPLTGGILYDYMRADGVMMWTLLALLPLCLALAYSRLARHL